jgi:hypothetical protein
MDISLVPYMNLNKIAKLIVLWYIKIAGCP